MLDQLVYKDGWEVKTVKQLKTRVKFCLRDLDDDLVQATMKTLRKLLRKYADKGPFFQSNTKNYSSHSIVRDEHK